MIKRARKDDIDDALTVKLKKDQDPVVVAFDDNDSVCASEQLLPCKQMSVELIEALVDSKRAALHADSQPQKVCGKQPSPPSVKPHVPPAMTNSPSVIQITTGGSVKLTLHQSRLPFGRPATIAPPRETMRGESSMPSQATGMRPAPQTTDDEARGAPPSTHAQPPMGASAGKR